MSLFLTLKKNAKLALAGSWGAAIGTMVTVGGIGCLISGLEYLALRLFVGEPFMRNPTMEMLNYDLSQLVWELFTFSAAELIIFAVFTVLSLLLLSPLSLGVTRWFYTLIHGDRPSVAEVFFFFETLARYLRALWYTVQMYFRAMYWAIVFFIIPGGVMGVAFWFLRTPEITRETRSAASAGILLACVFLLLSTILYAICVCKYALAAYLLCESDSVTVRDAFRGSIRYTKGYRGTILLFALSFIAWFLASPFTLFLLLIFVMPYFCAANTLLARYLVEKRRLSEPDHTQEWHPIRKD